MNYLKLIAFAVLLLYTFEPVSANKDYTPVNDMIRTYAIDDVVATSSMKETNDLRLLPGSVTVISPQAIQNRQVYALKDLSSYIPNLHIPDYGSRQTSAIYIRGVGARSSGQSIGLYVDNAPFLDKSSFDFELMDIQRIEVLRGPQGTLYGRNAMGGIINIYTLSPFDYQGTRMMVTGGNHGVFKTKFSHYAKLNDDFGISFSQYYDRNNGFFKNEYTGDKVDKLKSLGTKLKLDWRVTPNFTAAYSIGYDYTDQGEFAYGLYNKETGVINPVNFNDPSNYNRRVLNNNLSLQYHANKFVLSSTTSYQYMKDDMHMDQDFTPKSIFTLNQKQQQKAFTEEITLKSNTSHNYQWSAGAFGFYNQLNTQGPVTFKEDGIQDVLQKTFDDLKENNPGMPAFTVLDNELYIPGDFETPSWGAAVYHQSTYNNLFTEGLSLTAGVRLDYEKQQMKYNSQAKMDLGFSVTPGMPSIPLSNYWDEYTIINEKISQDFWQVLPKVSLRYQCTPSTFTYFSVAKGYKTGGYNVQMSADVMQTQMQVDMMAALKELMDQMRPGQSMDDIFNMFQPLSLEEAMSYKPEQSWNYELGMRSELIEDRLHTELTFFYTDIRDLQITKFVETGNGRILANAGKARSYGIEATLQAKLTDNLTADFNYGYTNATFRDYIYEKSKTEHIDCNGNYVPYIPQHTLNIGLQYTKLLRNKFIDQFTAAAQVNGTGKIYWTEINDITQNFYSTVNVRVGVRKGMVKLDVWSRNLSDTQFSAFYFESFGNPFIQKGKPFQIGVDLALVF